MGTFTGWRQRLRRQVEANVHRSSREVTENQWVFDPAIVEVTEGDGSAVVVLTRALEPKRPELTAQRWERRYSNADGAEVAAREIGRFIATLR